MKRHGTDIATFSRRVGAIGLALLAVPIESAFMSPDGIEETLAAEIAIAEEPSPLIETRTELLAALDARAPKLSELERVWLADIVANAAYRHGVDPFLVLAVMMVESEFRDIAKSHRGAVGFMQLRGPTGFEMCDKMGMPMAALGLYDWEQNVELGTAYLRFLRDRMGSWPMALAGYNWGPANVYRGKREAGGDLPRRMRAYEKRVSRAYTHLTRDAGAEARDALRLSQMDVRGAI